MILTRRITKLITIEKEEPIQEGDCSRFLAIGKNFMGGSSLTNDEEREIEKVRIETIRQTSSRSTLLSFTTENNETAFSAHVYVESDEEVTFFSIYIRSNMDEVCHYSNGNNRQTLPEPFKNIVRPLVFIAQGATGIGG